MMVKNALDYLHCLSLVVCSFLLKGPSNVLSLSKHTFLNIHTSIPAKPGIQGLPKTDTYSLSHNTLDLCYIVAHIFRTTQPVFCLTLMKPYTTIYHTEITSETHPARLVLSHDVIHVLYL